MFLYEKIDAVREFTPIAYKPLPEYVARGLNPAFELRPYQVNAFCNFITYYEGAQRPNPTQVLFHMATGSGKTLIMAGLILYLYKQGYRNFLFFVNLDNIVKKTKDNFLNKGSAKYLFADDILIDGERIPVVEVENFQGVNPDAINICFTTTQGLHSDIWFHKENAPTFDDFAEQKTVLIADEAHHLNVDTRKGKLDSKEEEESKYSWETTVTNIFQANAQNVLLEFTATCDLQNPYILAQYTNRIIFNYPLKVFREERFSKQVRAIRADISYEDRELQALMFSQYRFKVFQDHRLAIKPVILFKSKTILESKANETAFHASIKNLTGDKLARIIENSTLEEVQRMGRYFAERNIGYDALAHELQEEFSPEHCISVNDDKEADARQILLNSLESKDNPYRAIFEVKKLDEGWDVLNLFDIVRLYETRDANKGKPGASTIAEAQLIGRGARYCPFALSGDDERFKRKYDGDTENPLRICEELYYHCQYDSRYIDELNKALIVIGISPEKQTDITYKIKDEFKKEDFYLHGLVFSNKRKVKSRKNVRELLPSIREKEYFESVEAGRMAVDTMMMNAHTNTTVKTFQYHTTIGAIAQENYSLVHAALRRCDAFKFNLLKKYFPNLTGIRKFITDDVYLGKVAVLIESREEKPALNIIFTACLRILCKIGAEITSIKETYIGTREFSCSHFHEIFKAKTLHITDPHGEGEGISQNADAIRPEWKINLADQDWFIFNDNFGTTEEKAFVAFFATYVERLKKEYEKVYLVRNERQLVLYSFEGGERFEPDYLLFLRKKNATGFEQYQLFLEPKGNHLLEQDKWKEDFLLQIAKNGKEVKTFVDDGHYHVLGMPFFNQENRMKEIREAFEKFLAESTN